MTCDSFRIAGLSRVTKAGNYNFCQCSLLRSTSKLYYVPCGIRPTSPSVITAKIVSLLRGILSVLCCVYKL